MNVNTVKSAMIPRSVLRSRRQAGSLMLFFVAALGLMLAFMGLAFDASYMYYYKRRMQTAADAGALGAAQ